MALARALVNRPKVLLLDEPLGALDLKLREQMQVELKELQREVGITFVFVTHDQGEALSMSDRVAVFNHGRIEQVGSPRDVYEHPATEFVAGFVGTANLLPDGDGLVTVRPERIRFGAPADDELGATGIVDAAQYLGCHHPLPGAHGRWRTTSRSRWPTPPRHPRSPSATRCSSPGEPPTASGWARRSPMHSQQTDHTNPGGTQMRSKRMRLVGAAMALVFIAAACGDDDDEGGGDGGDADAPAAQDEIGEGEGAVSILAWPYYAEDGTFTDGLDWVSSFEEATGCEAEVKYFGTSDEAYTLFKSGDYDVVSASGDSSLRTVADGDAAAINTDLIEHYDELAPFMKEQANNSVDGTVYGIPHGWGANVLQFNTEVVDPAPTSWAAVFDPDSPYAGKIAGYDSPIYIADAAVYLMATQPDLGIENPYALDEEQFDGRHRPAEGAERLLSEYWSDYVAYEDNFRAGSTVLGTSWEVITRTLQADDPPTPVDVRAARGGLDRVGGQLDDPRRGRAPELRVRVDQPHHLARGPGRAVLHLRRGTGQPGRLRDGRRALRAVPRGGRGVLRAAALLDDTHQGVPRRAHRRGVQGLRRMGRRRGPR